MNKKYFQIAIEISKFDDDRTFKLGAVGIRDDGVLVTSRNGNSYSTKGSKFVKLLSSHAEGRLLKKLNCNSIIYVARVTRSNEIALAKPCEGCACMIKARRIDKVYYTIDNYSYGLWLPKKNKYYTYNF